MITDAFEWRDEYSLGVEKLDNAHKELFSLVNRIIRSFTERDFDKKKNTCIEAVKYLKTYTVRHFAEEEAYQLSIGYAGYRTHKKIHDNMRCVVIPALERELAIKSYSKESLEHFVGVCAGWLATHVLIEDQAITGKTKSKWRIDHNTNHEDLLDAIIKGFVRDLFRMSASLVSRNYAGDKLGKLFCYNDVLTAPNGATYSVVTAIEESVLEAVTSSMINSTLPELDELMFYMISEIFRSFNVEVMMALLRDSLNIVDSKVIYDTYFYKLFENEYPTCSMLWRTEHGYIAFCVNKEV